MQECVGKKVMVGSKISKYSKQQLGYGLYSHNQHVYASVIGTVTLSSTGQYSISNNFPTKSMGIRVGDQIYGQITRVREDEAFVSVMQVNGAALSSGNGKSIQATIRKQHVRQKLIDQVVMIDSFRPSDIVKARVISMGDSIRNLYLTTAAEDLGVVVAKNQQSNQLMLPFDWTSMIDLKSNTQEKRKVARPDL